jgi:hypothetical protein
MHVCPSPGCTVKVPYEQLACPTHWYSIPRPLRVELLRAYREHCRPGKPQKPEGPTRNGPCPCRSGKKYERRCGES